MSSSTPFKVVVSTWGNSLFWRDAVYVCGDVQVDSCSSIVSLLKHLIDTGGLTRVRKLYLLGLDSIVDVDLSKAGKYKGLCADAFKECYERFYKENELNNYTGILAFAKNIYECVLTRLLTNSTCVMGDSGEKTQCFSEDEVKYVVEKTSIVILPATGSPGGRWVFSGCPEDYLAIALPRVVRDALRSLESDVDSIEVVFDATHGINYTPTLTFRLVELLAQFMRLKYRADVKIRVYNSDPYPPANGSTGDKPGLQVNSRPKPDVVEHIPAVYGKPKLNLNLVYETHVTEVEVPRVEASPKVLKPCKQLGEPPSDLGKVIKEFRDHYECVFGFVRNIASSVYSPAPLALIYACYWSPGFLICREKFKVLEEAIDKVLETWVKNVVVDNTGSRPMVKRLLSVDSTVIWAMLFCSTICQYVDEIAGKPGATINIGRMSAFNHDVLQTITDELYGKVYSVMNYLIDHELSQVKLFAESLRGQGTVHGCYEYKSGRGEQLGEVPSQTSVQRGQDVTERIVIAHAALPYGYVDVCIQGDKVYLKYSSEDELGKVLEKLKRVYDERGSRRSSDGEKRRR